MRKLLCQRDPRIRSLWCSRKIGMFIDIAKVYMEWDLVVNMQIVNIRKWVYDSPITAQIIKYYDNDIGVAISLYLCKAQTRIHIKGRLFMRGWYINNREEGLLSHVSTTANIRYDPQKRKLVCATKVSRFRLGKLYYTKELWFS